MSVHGQCLCFVLSPICVYRSDSVYRAVRMESLNSSGFNNMSSVVVLVDTEKRLSYNMAPCLLVFIIITKDFIQHNKPFQILPF
jgi:hypothetical protein